MREILEHIAHEAVPDPFVSARGSMKKPLPKRFYHTVSVSDESGILLDGKPMRTPAGALLALPTKAFAAAVAAEWDAVASEIDPTLMPMTKLANSAIDTVTAHREAVMHDVVAYAHSDCVCYMAEAPQELQRLQTDCWQPVRDAFAKRTGIALQTTSALAQIAQDARLATRIFQELESLDPFALAALSQMTSLMGSVVLALSVLWKGMTPEQAWQAAHVDEDYQMSQWGEDWEAQARREHRARDFFAAANVLQLTQAHSI